MPSTPSDPVPSPTDFESSSADSSLADGADAVFRHYAALTPFLHPESGLGGQLLYAGTLDISAHPLLRAAHIGGAATLTVSASPEAQREALRSGAADFLVHSLDEALRILKNEIRRRRTVSVVLSGSPADVGQELLARGVQPDLLPAATEAIVPPSARATFLTRGAHLLTPQPPPAGTQFRVWLLPEAWMRRLAQLDARLLDALPAEDFAARRWLRLAPRSLASRLRKLRSVCCTPETAARIQAILDEPPEAGRNATSSF